MPADSKLELVVEVDVNKANASIKSINTGLSSMEQAASKAAQGASAGIDGRTLRMTKGAAASQLLADAIEHALECGSRCRRVPRHDARARSDYRTSAENAFSEG